MKSHKQVITRYTSKRTQLSYFKKTKVVYKALDNQD